MFVKSNLLRRLRYKVEDEPLVAKLREVFGADAAFGSEKLQTLLVLVMRNATTDSPWPFSNNPYTRYVPGGGRAGGIPDERWCDDAGAARRRSPPRAMGAERPSPRMFLTISRPT